MDQGIPPKTAAGQRRQLIHVRQRALPAPSPLLSGGKGEGQGEGCERIPGWPQVVDHWKLTPCEGRALHDIYAGEKFAAIGRKYGGTAHAIDKHWREIQRKMAPSIGGRGRVLVTRAIADFLADLRQQAAVGEAVEKATAPLEREIAELRKQVSDILQAVADSQQSAARSMSRPEDGSADRAH
jgi:hypothetical protein